MMHVKPYSPLLRIASALIVVIGFVPTRAFLAGLPCRLPATSHRGAASDPGEQGRHARQLRRRPAAHRMVVMMGRGLGRSKKAPKLKETPPTLTTGESFARAMLDKYNELRREGGEMARVHARVKGTERWYPVGNVCTEPGKTAEGVQAVKRLMLDHADTLYMELRSGSGNRLQLEIGYSKKEGDEVTVCKAKHSGEAVGAALDPLPNGPFFRSVDTSGAGTFVDKSKASDIKNLPPGGGR